MTTTSPDAASAPPSGAREPGKPWELPEVAEFFHICLATAQRAGRSGRLRTIKVGRRVLVPDDEVRRAAAEGF